MIAVAGGKGGSGKTTTTLGVARSLTRTYSPEPTVAVDADWDLPNLAALANAVGIGNRDIGERDIDGRDIGERDIGERRTTAAGAPDGVNERASIPIDRFETVEALVKRSTSSDTVILDPPADPLSSDPYRTFTGLATVLPQEVPILLDCPAGSAPDAAAPLRAADASVLVTTLSPPALRDTAKTAAMARALDCDPIGVIITRTERSPERLVDFFDCPLLGSVPTATQSTLQQRSVIAAYDTISNEIDGRYR